MGTTTDRQKELKRILQQEHTRDDLTGVQRDRLTSKIKQINNYTSAIFTLFRSEEPRIEDCLPSLQNLSDAEIQLIIGKLVLEHYNTVYPERLFEFISDVCLTQLSSRRDNDDTEVLARKGIDVYISSFLLGSRFFTADELATIREFFNDRNLIKIDAVFKGCQPLPKERDINTRFDHIATLLLANQYMFKPLPILQALYDTYFYFSAGHAEQFSDPGVVLHEFGASFQAYMRGKNNSLNSEQRKAIQNTLTSDRFLRLRASLVSDNDDALCRTSFYLNNNQQQSAYGSLSGLIKETIGLFTNIEGKKDQELYLKIKDNTISVYKEEKEAIESAVHTMTSLIISSYSRSISPESSTESVDDNSTESTSSQGDSSMRSCGSEMSMS